MKRLIIFTTLLITFASCSRQYKIARVVAGDTYIADAIDILDSPTLTDKTYNDKGHTLYIWEDVSLQVNQEEVVTAIHRQPASHEKTLQFWKHQYKSENTQFNKVSSSGQSDLWQFNIPAQGINVIYDERIDTVTKVIFYEAK